MKMAALDGLVFDFDPNSACVQRQHGSGREAAIGGPRGLAWAIGRDRAGRGAIEQLRAEPAQDGGAKPAKLRTRAEIARVFSRLATAFQHRPSNMRRQARREGQFSAIPAAPGRELLDPAELGLVDAGQARDRAPKLSPRTRTRTLQIDISGPYFIPPSLTPVRSSSRRIALFPCSRAQGLRKQAWERRKSLD